MNVYEPRLELHDGALVIGNSPTYALPLLQALIEQWGTSGVLGLVTEQEAVEICRIAPKTAAIRQTRMKPVEGSLWRHQTMMRRLGMSLYEVMINRPEWGCQEFMMRLGQSGYMPDYYILTSENERQQTEWYCNGAADLVIEVIQDGEDESYRKIKRDEYEAYGVSEYWEVDISEGRVQIFENSTKGFVWLKAGRTYESRLMPEVQFDFYNLLFGSKPWITDFGLRARVQRRDEKTKALKPDDGWGAMPFSPRFRMGPERITFEEFNAWRPEAKIEIDQGRLLFSGYEGTRNIIGMLMMTVGLAEVSQLAGQTDWEEGRKNYSEERQRALKAEAKTVADAVARSAMAMGASEVRMEELGERWSIWSAVTLHITGLHKQQIYELYKIGRSKNPAVKLDFGMAY